MTLPSPSDRCIPPTERHFAKPLGNDTSEQVRLPSRATEAHEYSQSLPFQTRVLPRGMKRARPLDDDGDRERSLLRSDYRSQTLSSLQSLARGSPQALACSLTPILFKEAKKRRTDKQATQEVQSTLNGIRLTLETLCSDAGMNVQPPSASVPLTIRIPARARRRPISKAAPVPARGDKERHHESQLGLSHRKPYYPATLLRQSSGPTLGDTPKIRLRVPTYFRVLRAMNQLEVTARSK